MILVNFEKELPRFTLRAAFLVQSGQVLVLRGESGSGKTTILECIAGRTHPDRGEIILNKTCVFSSFAKICYPTQDRKIGFVFHDYALFPHLTVAENIKLAEYVYPIRSASAATILNRFRIGHLAKQYPLSLSAGEQQRLSLARALAFACASHSSIILMDEPFAALDIRTREQMWNEFRDIQKEFALTVVLVTHQYEEASRLGDRVLSLRMGEVYE